MTTVAESWKAKQTDETRMVEAHLKPHFEQVDVYRYNLASIRIRVIDRRFEKQSRVNRDSMVEPFLDELPEETQRDIVTLFTFAPAELVLSPHTLSECLLNGEFENPTPSNL